MTRWESVPYSCVTVDISLRDDPRYNWWLVFSLLAAIYCLINLGLPRLPIDPFAKTYVIQPILWGLLAWAIVVLPRYRTAGGLRVKAAIIQLALMIGFFQVLLYVIGGLFSGFGRSPYAFTPKSILTNLVFVGSMLVGMELSRAWLVNRLGKKHTLLALIFVSMLYTLLSIPLARITGLTLDLSSISYLNSTVLPALAENLLASFLALMGGPLAAIVYRGILQAFWWFCPILPNLSWAFQGLIGTVAPVVGLVLANSLRSRRRPGQARRERRLSSRLDYYYSCRRSHNLVCRWAVPGATDHGNQWQHEADSGRRRCRHHRQSVGGYYQDR